MLTKELNDNLYLSIAVCSFARTLLTVGLLPRQLLREYAILEAVQRIIYSIFFFSFSGPIKNLKTNSGSILRQVNVFEREKVGGSRSPNVCCWQHEVRLI